MRLPFAQPYSDLRALQFRLDREATRKVWLKLHNIRLVRNAAFWPTA